jgi:enoyl-CoA hydratase/carnithine racemase
MDLLQIQNHPCGLTEVRLNRPDKRNALSFQMLKQLKLAGKSLARDRKIRVVLLTGAGPSFCAGIDLNDLREPRNRIAALAALLNPTANLFQQCFLVWRRLPVPVIAVIHGHCYGAGIQFALGADFRIAKTDSQIAIMESKWGLLPDMAASVTLRGLIGPDKAKELSMTSRVISGAEAHRIGLVSHVSEDPFKSAVDLAAEIVERSPDAVAGIKQLFNSMQSKSEYRTLALERRWQLRLLRGKNFIRSIQRQKNPEIDFEERSWS